MNFSDLLRRILADPAAVAPNLRVAMLAELGHLIVKRIRASEMWDQPPELLGYPEIARWREAYPADFSTCQHEYATAAPTLDFFADRFTPALGPGGPLAAALARGGDVMGYVAVMIGHFLTDRQKNHDPIGYRVFKNLEAVLHDLERAETVRLSGLQDRKSKPPRIRRASSVRFIAPVGDPPQTSVVELVLAAESLRGNVHKLAKLGKGAQGFLRPAVAGLAALGVAEFGFGDLLAPLQKAVRDAARDWAGSATHLAAEAEDANGEKISTRIRKMVSDDPYTTLDEHLGALAREVRAGIDAGKFQERTRASLHRLLDDWFAHMAETDADGDDPSLDDWALRLGVKRATLWDHLERLRELVRQVLARRAETGR